MPLSRTDLPNEKAKLRAQILHERGAISQEDRSAWDTAIRDAVCRSPEFEACRVLLCYSPVRGEIDLLPLARHAMTIGKQVAFPVSHTKDCTLTFHTVDRVEDLVTGAYGIAEPPLTFPIVTNTSEALCLVPALSFDLNGYRLGYGKGYYDRFLSSFRGVSLGLVYHALLRDRLPRNDTDRAVDRILTEKGEPMPHERKG